MFAPACHLTSLSLSVCVCVCVCVDLLVRHRLLFLKSADESDRDSMLVEADMARSLDALGWTKVGMCVCLCLAYLSVAARPLLLSYRLTLALHFPASSSSFAGGHRAGVRFQGVLPLAHNKIVALTGAGLIRDLMNPLWTEGRDTMRHCAAFLVEGARR